MSTRPVQLLAGRPSLSVNLLSALPVTVLAPQDQPVLVNCSGAALQLATAAESWQSLCPCAAA